MRLHIHLGAHKTATTHLQLCLSHARSQLRRRGVRYFGTRNLREAPSLGTALAETAPASMIALWRERLAARLTDARCAVMSEENIIGTMAPALLFGERNRIYPLAAERLARLLDMAGGQPATVFLSVRNPTDFVTSAFGMHMAGGNPPILSEYTGDFDVAALSWSELAARLLAVDGVAGIVVWPYEDYRRLRPQVLRALVGAGNVKLVPDQGPALRGWSRDAFHLYRQRFLDAAQGADLRALARESKAAQPKGDGREGMQPFGPHQRRLAGAAYARDLARLAAMERITFLTLPGTARRDRAAPDLHPPVS